MAQPQRWRLPLLCIGVGSTVLLSVVLAWLVRAAGLSDLAAPQATTFVVTAGASLPFTPVVGAVCYLILGARTGARVRRNRRRTVGTDVVRLCLSVAAAVVAAVAIDLLVAWVVLDPMALSWQMWRPLVAYLGYCLAFAVVGFGLAAASGRQVVAVVVGLGWPLVVEPIVNGLLTAWAVRGDVGGVVGGVVLVTNLLPASAGRRTMFAPYDMFAGLDSGIAVWGVGASTVVFWAGVVLATAGAAVLFRRGGRVVSDGVRTD